MGNLRAGRTMRKTCTLAELAMRCNDFGKAGLKAILAEAGIPYGFHKSVFSYYTEDALEAIYKYRKSTRKKQRLATRRRSRRQLKSEHRKREIAEHRKQVEAERQAEDKKRDPFENLESALEFLQDGMEMGWIAVRDRKVIKSIEAAIKEAKGK